MITDHKPLETIYGSSTFKPSARIERSVHGLQPYSFKVQYKAGSENFADYLSRHPSSQQSRKQERIAEEYVNMITSHSVPKAMSLDEIASATNTGKALQALRAAIRTDRWQASDRLKPYCAINDELTVGTKGIVLRGTRLVIPESLQQRAIDIAHEAHQGLSKTKSLSRIKVWFPGMEKLIQHTLVSCKTFQVVGKPSPPELLQQTDFPKASQVSVHIDFCGPPPSGDNILVVIGRYS